MAVKFFGQFLVQEGVVNVDQLREGLELMDRRNKGFSAIAIEKGYLSQSQVEQLTEIENATYKTTSEAAVDEGFLTLAQAGEILKEQNTSRLRIGEALVELGFIPAGELDACVQRFHEDQADYQVSRTPLPGSLKGHLMAEYVVDFFPKLIEKVSKLQVKVERDQTESGQNPLVASLAVTGRYGVRVSLSSDESFAEALLVGIIGPNLPTDHESLESALAEFLNIVLGNAIAALERHDLGAELDVPELGTQPKSGYFFPLVSTSGAATLGLEPL